MGKVYSVKDSLLNKNLALKILSDSSNENLYLKLKKEFETLSMLQHANLVKVYDLGISSLEFPYFTMDYILGQNLSAFFKIESNSQYLEKIIFSILAALQYLHEKNLLHGDIKPENIIVNSIADKVEVKLLDFGLALARTEKSETISGTLKYLAPEVISASKYSPASDLYALGITLIECLTDVGIPVSVKHPEEFYRDVYLSLSNNLKSFQVNNPSSLASFIVSLISRDIDQRPSSAERSIKLLYTMISLGECYADGISGDSFVFRENEVMFLEEFLLLKKSNRTVILKGLSGVGKKSIINKIKTSAQLQALLTIDLSDHSFDTDSLNRFILAFSDHLTPKQKSSLLSKHYEIIESIKGSSHETTPSKKDITPLIFDNIVRSIDELSHKYRVLFLIPDISRFGTDFLRFLYHLLYETGLLKSDVLFIISRNTDIRLTSAKERSWELIDSMAESISISIEPFTVDAVSKLSVEQFEKDIFSEIEKSEIITLTNGLPLYITAYFKYLISIGIISKSGIIWYIDRAKKEYFNVPGNLNELSVSMIDKLSETEVFLLRTISIWNPPIKYENLKEYATISGQFSGVDLKSLSSIGIVACDNKGNIKHIDPLIRNYIFKNTDTSILSEHSDSIAQYLAACAAGEHFKIATLFLASNNYSKALEHGLIASEKMIWAQEYYDAYDLLSKLNDISNFTGDKSHAYNTLKMLAPIEYRLGFIDDSLDHYVILANSSTSKEEKAEHLTSLALINDYLLGNIKLSQSYYTEARICAKKANNKDLLIKIMIAQGNSANSRDTALLEMAVELSKNRNIELYSEAISKLMFNYCNAGMYSKAFEMKELLLPLLGKIDKHNKSSILYRLYYVAFYHGDYSAAAKYIEDKIILDEQTCNDNDKIYSLNSLGGCYFIQGEFFRQIETLESALFLSMRFNSYQSSLLILSNLSGAYIHLADYGSALSCISKAEYIIDKNHLERSPITYLLKSCQIYMLLGDYFSKQYSLFSEQTTIYLARFHLPINLGHHEMIKSVHHFIRIDIGKALFHASKALEYFRDSDDRDDIVDALLHLCVYELENNNVEKASVFLNEGRTIFNEIHCNYLRPFLLYTEGFMAMATDAPETDSILVEALNVSKRMGTREHIWQTQRLLAIYHYNNGDSNNAISYYRDAIETIKQITESIADEEVKLSYLSLPFRKRVFDEIKILRSS